MSNRQSGAAASWTDRQITPENIDGIIQDHVASAFADKVDVLTLSQHYRRNGYVKVSNLVPRDVLQAVTNEVHEMLALHAKRIDIKMKETGNTPRYMSTVGQKAIAKDAVLIPALYESAALKGFLSRLAAESVMTCPWEEEKYIMIKQDRVGDTHGWHWGDFSFTVIWVIEAPSLEFGGALQTIPHTDWDKDNPRTHEYILNNTIKTFGHATGDIYFLRSDTTLHRTIPLNADKTRIILNTCWASQKNLDKAAESTHETMQAMFD